MRKAWGWVLGALAIVTVAMAAWATYMFQTFEDPPVDPAWEAAGSSEIPEGAVTVRYTGTSTLVFSDGATTWMTDGWFSRPSLLTLLRSPIEPDRSAIEAGLARNEVKELAAVFPLHSHYDHAMDAPEVARRTGAILLGSESTANIGRGWGLPEDQIRVVDDRVPVRLGAFTVTPIESTHFQFADPQLAEEALGDPTIRTPLIPPADVRDYRVGKAYVLHVAHPKGRWLIVGSAGFVEGALEGFDADVVFLGVGALGSQTDTYRDAFWEETIDRTGPSRVVPIHWDSLTGPIEGPFTGPVRAVRLRVPGNDVLRAFLLEKKRANPSIEFITLPRYDPVVLF